MKTIAVIVILFLSFEEIQAQDQIKQGVYSLGGSIGYSSSSYGTNSFTSNITNLFFEPGGSYFIVDQLELSFGIGYSYEFETVSIAPNMKWNTLSLNFGPRYYFPCGKVAPFIGANGSVEWMSNNGSSYSPQTSYSFIGGVEIFISKTAALQPAIEYENPMPGMSSQSSPSHELVISIGVKYFIL
jgi:hypothetical protein